MMNSKNPENIYYTKVINDTLVLKAGEITKDINILLSNKLKSKIGDKCCRDGYVKKDSIKILNRSIGTMNTAHFNADIVFNIQAEVLTCNPLKGDLIKCTIVGKNKMGIMCQKQPLLIVLSKIHHIDSMELFESKDKGDLVTVEVIDSKFELNDTEINLIGKLIN